MASPKLPWVRLWTVLWSLIPQPTVNGRLLIALDDFINPKTGKKIFGCAPFSIMPLRSTKPDIPGEINNRQHFAFSDVRKLITQAALDKDFSTLCPHLGKPMQKSFIGALLRLVA